jgi:hypothetical protein
MCVYTYLWNWALLEKRPIVQALKRYPAFYGTRRFITVFTRALQWSLSEPDWPSPHHPILSCVCVYIYSNALGWRWTGLGLVIGFIGLLNTQLVTTLYNSLSHTDCCSQSRSSLRCLVTSSNSECPSAPWLTSPQAGDHITPTSSCSDYPLRTQLVLVYIASSRTVQRTPLPTSLLLLCECLLRPFPNSGRVCRPVP